MARDGKSFYYVNPLESIRGIAGIAPTQRHCIPQRPSWYACACCPPNIARTIMSFGKYAYGESGDTAFCHLYAAGEVSLENGISFSCETAYPFGDTVTYRIRKGGRIAVRIPRWSRQTALTLNGQPADAEIRDGYAYTAVSEGDVLAVKLDMHPRTVYPSARIPALSGEVCIMRGALVYCFESLDNGGDILGLSLTGGSITECEAEGLKGVTALSVPAVRRETSEELYSDAPPKQEKYTATAIPYFCRANRGETDMRVYLPYM